jgi:hypothetical protein
VKKLIASVTALAAMFGLAVLLTGTPVSASTQDANAQLAQLYQLQAGFHRAASVRDNVNGDAQTVVDDRIRDMLSLWAANGSLTLQVGSAFDGKYTGRGELNPGGCPMPSTDPTDRGTLCTFFRWVAGSFKAQNKLVSLAPSYMTHFDIHGNTAGVYFECHYFNVALGTDGKPVWTSASHVEATGTAVRVNGTWLFQHLDAPVPVVPLGS